MVSPLSRALLGGPAVNQPQERTTRQSDALDQLLDAQLVMGELEAVELHADIVAPPEMDVLAGTFAEKLQGVGSSGDHMRLPRLTYFDGPQLRASIDRMARVDTTTAVASKDAVVKEARMLRVLRALQEAGDHIRRQSSLEG